MRKMFAMAILILVVPAFGSNSASRRAVITGAGGIGKCTIEVNVDGAAEVEVSGDTGALRTLSGQPSVWRRFQCNAPMPRNPVDFRFVGVDGRGRVLLLRDPRSNHGVAVIHINDPKGGREGYTFDLQWRGAAPPPPPPPLPGRGGLALDRAVSNCQDSVTDRLHRDGYRYVNFDRTAPDHQPGHNDSITGSASGKRGLDTARFWFSCSVSFPSGKIRSVDVRRR